MADKEKILIIEDDFFIRELYERQFTKEGYIVLVAEDGPTGLVMASQELPQLILLDIMLPKLNGLDLLRTLKSKDETKGIPVILLTNLGQESVIKEGFELGAESYLIKSAYTPSQIIEEIKNFLENRG
ncbi:response regulator [bacterium]|uniref:Response regulator n=2 Tax=Katanobacteria TaxID=422282 RepID=A0A2M7X1F1_UNCKA|nr:response regulator [bacterium]PIP56662.1 MAG: response regulator [candidate division WWE3 bacterium CG22_combo_CG10-13_8_21_14_all_39_12]PJA40003.1 MAG: response regulator [candidate division WWE3 bacterium CG_4_9_14_3_um_filter_39_7]